jgi:hypothetical protein
MDLVLYFLAGTFVFNSIPHIASGVIGNKHMTPFGKDSSAFLNVLWGFLNLYGGVLLLNFTSSGIKLPNDNPSMAAFLVGGLVMSLMAASLFSNPNAKMPWWK